MFIVHTKHTLTWTDAGNRLIPLPNDPLSSLSESSTKKKESFWILASNKNKVSVLQTPERELSSLSFATSGRKSGIHPIISIRLWETRWQTLGFGVTQVHWPTDSLLPQHVHQSFFSRFAGLGMRIEWSVSRRLHEWSRTVIPVMICLVIEWAMDGKRVGKESLSSSSVCLPSPWCREEMLIGAMIWRWLSPTFRSERERKPTQRATRQTGLSYCHDLTHRPAKQEKRKNKEKVKERFFFSICSLYLHFVAFQTWRFR